MTMNCGHCGKTREPGDVCCIAQAKNQGRIHAMCNHEPPPMAEDLLIVYRQAAESELDRIGND
jgi:hypothetical protein